jgi:2-methylcitrate dehydratase PrpD
MSLADLARDADAESVSIRRLAEFAASLRGDGLPIHPEVKAATTAAAVRARITITMRDGTQHSAFVAAPKGSPSRPFTHDDHIARFERELSRRWPDRVRQQVIEIAESLSDLDKVSRITELLASRSDV